MAPETALSVEFWPIEDLVPNPRNARLHDEEQIAQIRRSIEEFGFTNPILLGDVDGEIVAGHGRRMAAQAIYADSGTIHLPGGRPIPQGTVPVIVAAGWSDEQRRAYTLADNQLALNATWDDDLLRIEIGELKSDDFDLGLIGFSDKDLDRLLADGGSTAGGSEPKASLAERFGIVPFSVLNAREGWWQDRKRAWLALGIQSEVGRGENLLKMSDTMLEPDPAKRAARKAVKEAA